MSGIDISTIGIAVETAGLAKGTAALKEVERAALKAADAADKVGTSSKAGFDKAAAAAASVAASSKRMDAAISAARSATASAATSTTAFITALERQVAVQGKSATEAMRYDSTMLGMTRTQRAHTDALLQSASAHERAARKTTTSMQSMAASVMQAAAAVMFLSKAMAASEEWTTLNNRIRLVTNSQAEFVTAQSNIINIANSTRQSLTATAELYQRLAMNQKQLGMTGNEMAGVVKTISQTMVISGTSAQGAEAALVQLGQAFASGVLRGEELNSVMEQAPALSMAIAAGMGKTVGELRALGAAGTLTAEAVVNALKKQAGAVETDFGKMAATIGQSTTVFSNKFTEFIGRMDDATGVSKALAAAIIVLSDNIGVAATIAATLVGVALAVWLGGIAVAAGGVALAFSGVAVAATAMMVSIGPAGWLILGIGAAATAWQLMGNNATTAGNQMDSAADKAKAAGDKLVAGIVPALDKISTGYDELIKKRREALGVNESADTGLAASLAEQDKQMAKLARQVADAKNGTGSYEGYGQITRGAAEKRLTDDLEATGLKRAEIYKKMNEANGLAVDAYVKNNDRMTEAQQKQSKKQTAATEYAEALRRANGDVAKEVLIRQAYQNQLTAIDVVKSTGSGKAAAATNKEISAYAGLTASIRSKIEEVKLEVAIGADATEAQKIRIKLDQDLASGKLKLSAAHEEALRVDIAALDTALAAQKYTEESIKFYEAQAKARYDASSVAVKAATDEADKNEELARTFGMTKTAIEALELSRLQEQRAQMGSVEMCTRETAALDALIAAKQRNTAAVGEVEALETEKKFNEERLADQKKTVEKYDDIFRTGFADMVNGGTNVWKSFTKSLATTFKTSVADQIYKSFAQPFVVKFIASMIGLTGASTAGAVGSAVSGGSGVMDAVGAISTAKNAVGGVGWLTNFGGSVAGASSSLGASIGGDLGAQMMMNADVIGATAQTFGTVLGYANAAYALSQGKYGQAAGAAIGTYFGGPIGSFIGGEIGKAVDNLFGGETRSGAAYVTNADGKAAYQQGPSGGEIAGASARGMFDAAQASIKNTLLALGSKSVLTGYVAGLESSKNGKGFEYAGGKIDGVGFGEYKGRDGGQFSMTSQDSSKAFADYGVQLSQSIVEALLLADDIPVTITKIMTEALGGKGVSSLTSESATALLTSINAVIVTVNAFNDATEKLPFENLKNLSFDAAAGLIAMSDGMEKLGANLGTYYDKFYSAEEKRVQTMSDVNAALDAFAITPSEMEKSSEVFGGIFSGIFDKALENATPAQLALGEFLDILGDTDALAAAGDTLHAQYRAIVDAQDVTTVSGQEMYAALISMSGVIDGLIPVATDASGALTDTATALAELAATNQSWQDKLDVMTGAQTDRSLALRDATDDTTKALMRQVYAQEDLQTAKSLEIELYALTHTAAEVLAADRNRELSAMDATLRPLQKLIYAQEDYAQSVIDTQTAVDAATAATQSAMSRLQTSVNAEKSALSDQLALDKQAITDKYALQADANKAQVDAAQEAANSISSIASALSNAIKQAQIESAQYDFARLQSARSLLSSSVNAPDLSKVVGLEDALDVAGQDSKQFYGTFEEYAFAQGVMAGDILSLNDKAKAQLTTAEAIVTGLAAQSDVSKLLSDAETAAAQAIYDSEVLRLDAVVATGLEQVNALLGIDDRVLSVADAIAALGVSITEAYAAQAASTAALAASVAAQAASAVAASSGYDSIGGGSSGIGVPFSPEYYFSGAVAIEDLPRLDQQQTAIDLYDKAMSTGGYDSNYLTQYDMGELAAYAKENNMSFVADLIAGAGKGVYDTDKILEVITAGGQRGNMSGQDVLADIAKLSADYLKVDGSHANGLDRVPFNGYRAELHRDEMVLTAPQANSVRNGRSTGNTERLESLVTALTIEVQGLRAEARATASHTATAAKLLTRAMPDGDAISTREVTA